MSKITTRCCTAKSTRLFLAVCFVLFLQVIFKTELKAQTDAGSTQNATAGVLGSCNLVIQNFKADIGARVLNQLDCPLSPTESFGVKYLWLDEVSTSFLISGYFDKSLNRLVGDAPLIVKNPVYIRAQEIIDRFGERVHGDSEILRQSTAFGLQTSKQDELGAIIKTTELSNIPARVLQKMKIYRSEPLLLPDLPALRTLVKTAEWPLDYNMTYRDWQFNFSGINFNKGGATAEKVAITCVLLHKLVDRDQLLSYWEDVEKLEAAIGAKELKQEDTISYQVLGSNIKSALVKNPTLDAMAYFGEEFWPDDYLISFGDAFVGPDCGYSGQYNVGLYLLPRRLYTLVAVVEAKAAHLEIDGFTYVVDPNERLRPPSKGSQAVEAPKGVISLKRGETVLIPLRIELRYLPEDAALRLARKKKAEELYSKIMSIPSKQFKLRYVPDSPDESAKIILQKLKTSYRKPELRSVAESYVFGPAYEIRDIQISGKKISVREVPPTPGLPQVLLK